MADDVDERFLAAVEKLQKVCEISGNLRKDLRQSILESITDLHSIKNDLQSTISTLKEQVKSANANAACSLRPTTARTFADIASKPVPHLAGDLSRKPPMFTAVVKPLKNQKPEELKNQLKRSIDPELLQIGVERLKIINGVCNFGYGWEYGSVKAVVQYKSFISENAHAHIGLKVGLRGINVTLKGLPVNQLNETINYNERFSWEWAQGRPGFGKDASKLNREYRAAQWRGMPYPILWVVEYFTIDEGNFRHGRYYRAAGWYCHIVLWMSFPLWILTNILLFLVIRYGAYYLSLTGICLLVTNILFHSIRNAVPVELRFQSKPLVLHYGWCFWLVLFTGLLCELLALLIIFMDLRYPEELAMFFGSDILQDYEDFYVDPAELGLIPPEVVSYATVQHSSQASSHSSSDSDYTSLKRASQEIFTLRKRTMSSRFQRASQKHPVPTPRDPSKQRLLKGLTVRASELPVYENLNLTKFDTIEEEEPKRESFEEILMRDIKTLNE